MFWSNNALNCPCWPAFCDLALLVECLPGAALTGPAQDGDVPLRFDVRLGPIAAGFVGTCPAGLVRELANALTAQFATNLAARLPADADGCWAVAAAPSRVEFAACPPAPPDNHAMTFMPLPLTSRRGRGAPC